MQYQKQKLWYVQENVVSEKLIWSYTNMFLWFSKLHPIQEFYIFTHLASVTFRFTTHIVRNSSFHHYWFIHLKKIKCFRGHESNVARFVAIGEWQSLSPLAWWRDWELWGLSMRLRPYKKTKRPKPKTIYDGGTCWSKPWSKASKFPIGISFIYTVSIDIMSTSKLNEAREFEIHSKGRYLL